MDSLLKMLTSELSGNTVKTISSQLGVDERKAQSAVPQALSLLVGALAKNTAQKDGARSLDQALAKDHDGSLLDNLDDFIGNFQNGPGEGILKHVLGSKLGAAEKEMGKQTGLDAATVGKLLTMLAPVVLGALGKKKQEKGLNADSLSRLLGAEQKVVKKSAPQSMSLLNQLLDENQDGEIGDDIARKGIGLLGKLMSKKRR